MPERADDAGAADATSTVDPGEELLQLAAETAVECKAYVTTVTEVAAGSSPDIAIPMLLLASAQLLLVGSRLGAIQDIVLVERFEADPGPDADIEPLRDNLANLFEGLDDYADVVDPVTQAELTKGSLSNDITEICLALSHVSRCSEDFTNGKAMNHKRCVMTLWDMTTSAYGRGRLVPRLCRRRVGP